MNLNVGRYIEFRILFHSKNYINERMKKPNVFLSIKNDAIRCEKISFLPMP